MQTFTIEGRLPGYNELNKGSWHVCRRVKLEAMNNVMWSAKIARLKPIKGQCEITIACFEPNARRDVDNVTSGAGKVVLDALQQMGLLQGDGRKYVNQVGYPHVEVDRKRPRVEVEIREIKR